MSFQMRLILHSSEDHKMCLFEEYHGHFFQYNESECQLGLSNLKLKKRDRGIIKLMLYVPGSLKQHVV